MDGLYIATIVDHRQGNPRNDAASVIELKDGSLLLAWDEYLGEHGDDNDNCRISATRSCDGGKTWGEHRVLVEPEDKDFNISQPDFLRLDNGEIIFLYTHWHSMDSTSRVIVRSINECESFTKPVYVWKKSKGYINAVFDRSIQLSTGRILIPLERLEGRVWGPNDNAKAGCYYSEDGGHTWREPAGYINLPMRGAEEPSATELVDGTVLLYVRTQLGSIFGSHSTDGGLNWSLPQTIGLRSPLSCQVLTRIPESNDLLLIWNYSLYEPKLSHTGLRTPLTAAISTNGGKTWKHHKNLETDPNRQFTNQSCYWTSKGKAIITYTTCQNREDGNFADAGNDLKIAIIDREWFYHQ